MNRWVGIVSLRETAPPTPVHRIALAIEAARRRTSYEFGGRNVPYTRMRSALRTLGQEYASQDEWDRYAYCIDLAGDFFDGGQPPVGLPSWLTAELRELLSGIEAPRNTRWNSRASTGKVQLGDHRTRYPRGSEGTSARVTTRTDRRGSGRLPSESIRPYSRVVRPLEVRDVAYAPLCQPPADLVGTFGDVVRTALGETVGDWSAGPEVTAWLGLAAEHRSHLYESHHTDRVTPNVLGLLDRLGGTATDVILLDAYARWATPRTAGVQSTEHARRRSACDPALGQWAVQHSLVRMGAGEARQPADSVYETVARQILGALSLCGEHEVASRLVAAVWPDLDRPATEVGADPVTLAGTAFRAEELTYDYSEEGPDHRKVFRATARTCTGRTAEGTGPSKKAARATAAKALLDKYPRAVRAGQAKKPAPVTGTSGSPLPYPQPGNRHREAVSDLAMMFELGHRADGLLAQALTHASWLQENRGAVTAARQCSNEVLAHHGSHVINHLAAHGRASRALARDLTPDEDETRVLSVSDEDTAQLGEAFQLVEGLLTSHGESGQRRTAVSDATQAVVAAAWRTHGPRLLQRRPVVVDGWLTGLEHRHDPVTVLSIVGATYGIDLDYEYASSGPDHLRSFTATAHLRDVRGRVCQWTEQLPGTPGKPEAKQATARAVLDIFAAAATDFVDALSDSERELLTYLLRAQADGLGSTSERQRARILARGDLGTGFLATGDTEAFLAWADRVTGLLGPGGTSASEPWRELYRKIISDTRQGPRSLLHRMAADQGTDAESVVRRHAAECVRRAATTSAQADESVRDILQDWWRDQAPRIGVSVQDDMRHQEPLLLLAQLGALHETLKWCGEAAEAAETRIEVELTVEDGTLHVWINLDNVDVRATCDDFGRLLSRVLPWTDCIVAEDHFLLRLHASPGSEGLPPLAVVGLAAYLGA